MKPLINSFLFSCMLTAFSVWWVYIKIGGDTPNLLWGCTPILGWLAIALFVRLDKSST